MKRLYIILLLLLLFSCIKEDNGLDSLEDGAISISTTLASESKGAVVSAEADMKTLGIYCEYSGSADWSANAQFAKMNNKKVNYITPDNKWVYEDSENTNWGHSSLYDKYTFFAYSPFNDDANSSSNGVTPSISNGELSLNYVTPASAAEHVDLLISTPLINIYPQVGGNVWLTMNHALSCIDFMACGSTGAQVTKIELKGFCTTGDITYNRAAADGVNPVECVTTAAIAGNVVYTDGLKSKDDQALASDKYNPIVADNGYLLMVPQTIPTDAKIVITYKMSADGAESTKEFPAPTTQNWEPSKRYTYKFKLSEQILLDPEVIVTAWDEEAKPESYYDDAFPLPAINCINLDIYNTSEKLTATVEERLEAGETEFIAYGELASGVNLGGTNSTSPEIGFNAKGGTTQKRVTSLDLTRVNGLTEIGSYTFYNNESLTKIILPKTVTRIIEYAFSGCTSLSSINLNNITEIGENAFNNCSSLPSN